MLYIVNANRYGCHWLDRDATEPGVVLIS